MPENLKNNILRNYLLGSISEQIELDSIEERLLKDKEYLNELENTENELIEDYVFGELTEDELDKFKKLFLTNKDRVEKIKITESLHKIAVEEQKTQTEKSRKSLFDLWFFKPQFAFGLVLIAAIAIGVFVIFKKNNRNDSELILANIFSIYEKERPTESRIVGQKYSPLVILRGKEENSENLNKKRKIETQLLEKIDEKPTAESYNALGVFYLTERKFDEAIIQFENGIKLDQKNAEIYSNLGAAFYEKANQAKNDEKIEILPKSLESLNKAIELDNSKLEAIFNKALVLQDLNLPREAINAWKQYLEKDNSSQWADEARKNLEQLESSKQNAFKPKEKILEDFLSAFREKNDSLAWKIHSQTKETTTLRFLPNQLVKRFIKAKAEKLPDIANESVSALNYIGSLEESETADFFFKDLAFFFQKFDDQNFTKLQKAFELADEGYSFLGKSDYENAQAKFEESRDLFIEIGDIWDAKTLEIWIGQCLLRKGKLEESKKLLTEISEFAREKKYKWLEASSLDLIATNYFLNNDHSKALEINRQALEISEKISDTYKIQRISMATAEIYNRIGEAQKAFFYMKKALALEDLYFQSDRQAWRNYIFGSEVFSRLNFFDAAIAFGGENLVLGNEILNNAAVNHNSHISLSKLYAAKKDYKNALENAEKSREMALKLNQDSAQKTLLADTEVQIGFIQRQTGNFDESIASYDKALALYSEIPNLTREFFYAKKGKLICFQAKNDREAVEKQLPEVLEIFEKYRTKILEEQARNVFFDDEQTIYDIAIDNYLYKNDETKAFETVENSKARSLLDFIANKAAIKNDDIEFSGETKSLTLSEIQQKIPAEVQLVQFGVLPEKIVVWILNSTEFKTVKIEVSKAEIEQKVNDYLKTLVSDKDNLSLINRQSAEIYNLLISPLKSHLDNKKEIFIIPDKVLNLLPFASLYDESNKKYLIENYTIGLSPSATVFVIASEKSKLKNAEKNEKLLSIGNPSFNKTENPELINLKSAEREVSEISEFYPQATQITGENAAKNILLRELEKNDILHFAGHYLANKTSPLNSKLLLADKNDGESDLKVFEIAAQKNINLKLAVLSACQTGLEKYYNGEGAVGIARIFLAIGVPSVVASQWEVDSDSTADLMIDFHQNRKKNGFTVARALREAQIKAIKNQTNSKNSPFYWSAFNTVGGFTNY